MVPYGRGRRGGPGRQLQHGMRVRGGATGGTALAPERAMGEEPSVESGGPAEPRGSVLVVDDSRLVRTMVAVHLKSAGLAVEEAENGEAALRLLSRGTFDVIITDLRMPELDGFGVLAAVKRLGLTVEVIILTGAHAQDMSSAVRALRLGAHDYLTKPPSSADEVILTVGRPGAKKRLRDENNR